MLTHVKGDGSAHMVDVGEKGVSKREAVAEAMIFLGKEIVQAIIENQIKKGDVLATARIAGIMGAKETSRLIPMCHSIMLTSCEVEFKVLEDRIHILAKAKCKGITGVEMEALTAASVAALTIYDMTKSMGKDMEILYTRLVSKSGGKSGDYFREEKQWHV